MEPGWIVCGVWMAPMLKYIVVYKIMFYGGLGGTSLGITWNHNGMEVVPKWILGGVYVEP
jgi:hypothetical protein